MGGSAFNGRSLVTILAGRGHDVTVCNRGRTVVEHPAGVDLLVADRTDHAQVRQVLGGTEWDCVIDMTAYHPSDIELMIDVFNGSVGHFIFVSSTVTYAAVSNAHPGPIDESHPDERGPNQYEYGMDKILSEELLFAAHADRGFPGTSVPLSMVFGPHNALPGREQRMFSRMLLGRPVLVPGDGETMSVVGYVDDQSEAFEQLMGVPESFGRRLNLTGNDPHSYNRYVQAFAQVVGVEPEIVHIPADLMDDLWDKKVELSKDTSSRATMDVRPTDRAYEAVMPHIHKTPLANLIQRLQPSIHRWDQDQIFSSDAMQHVADWTPAHNFEQAVEATYAWWSQTDQHATVKQDFAYEDEILELVRSR